VAAWSALLAPYTAGQTLADCCHIAQLQRGADNEVVIEAVGSDGAPAAEVHILPRGCWSDVAESQSFGIGYEVATSPAAEPERITSELADALRRRDDGLPPPDAIPLRDGFDLGVLHAALRGHTAVLLALNVGLILALFLFPHPAVFLSGVLLGATQLVTR